MSEREIYDSIRAEKLVGREAWDDITSAGLGLFPILCVWGMLFLSLGFDVVKNRPISWGWVVIFMSSGILLFYGSYKLIYENKLSAIKTNLDASTNKALTKKVIEKLQWTIIEIKKYIIVAEAEKEWGATTEKIVVLMADNYIYINVKYKSGSKARLPFLTGFSEKKIKEIKKEIDDALNDSTKANEEKI
ncbi:hypothetical protein GXP67_08400 [Rhodocytophaga rosea]|uniref:Uncharacterized protein n=1 Tax=Rhodocytophaga rosea TaxID=2704465 RepID=A0A6C0GFG8_9BACT|nr:hypothetical protein [Rhodocytophaga rosea]QHT66677.1 hypothetical protein GXP67_08400 [Rhodocytophaga rosea]